MAKMKGTNTALWERRNLCAFLLGSVALAFIAAKAPGIIRWSAAAEAEYQAIPVQGTSTLKGQAFLLNNRGDVRYGAGSWVTLDPKTSYSEQYWNLWGRAWKEMFTRPPHDFFRQARRETVADGDGRFEFGGLPAGTYYLRTTVWWSPQGWPQGGLMSVEVAVREGESKTVVLTDRDIPKEGRATMTMPKEPK